MIAGCGKDDPADSEPLIETYTGTYMTRNTTEVIGLAKKDSVTFVITDGIFYSMTFREVSSTDQLVDFCDHEGTLNLYTGTVMDFVPEVFLTSNCDTLRVPRGPFTLDFRTHEPEIYVEKSVGDSLFQMVLLQQ
ncbi:MAG: hypothetical protein AB1483_09045 [Candidatus Zixiibacteriota bacterium]